MMGLLHSLDECGREQTAEIVSLLQGESVVCTAVRLAPTDSYPQRAN
jgi:hypothetical protein